MLDDTLHGDTLLVYIDEAHIGQDTDGGYGWSICGQRFWVSSCSPGLAKVSLYGVYLYNLGQVRLFAYDKAERFNTIDILLKLRSEFLDRHICVIWDGASYHRAEAVRETASLLDIRLQPLPAYSPDFMPVEHLWRWLREDVTYHACYTSRENLLERIEKFQEEVNAEPIALADRLWVKNHLEFEEEKLRVSI